MNRRHVSAVLALVLGLCVSGTFLAADKPAKPAKGDDKQVVDSKATKRASAKAVNFRKAFNLPYRSLDTLGARIESARRAPDPVALAHAASELAVAEKVSGKKAPLTSAAVLNEAAQLAKLRREAAELRANLEVARQLRDETGVVDELKQALAEAEESTRKEKAAVLAKEEPTGAPRRVLVNNYTTQYIDVYVNGNYKVQLLPGGSKWFVIEHKWNPTVLTAYGNEDETHWGPRYIWGNFKTYTWNFH